jgi:hypothetical protein
MSRLRFTSLALTIGLLTGLLIAPGASASRTHVAGRPVAATTGRYSSLEQAVRAGALDRRLMRQVRRGSSEAMVTFRGGAALRRAVATASTRSKRSRSTSIARSVRSAYAAIKAHALAGLRGTAVHRDYSLLPISAVRVSSPRALLTLLNRAGVAGVGANRVFHTTLAESLPLIGQPTAASSGYTGTGAAVAVMDTGVDYLTTSDERTAFGNCTGVATPSTCRIAFAQDFAPDDGVLDDNGHGTNVAGIVAGVAPGAKILAMDVFDGDGASSSDVVDAINSAIANQATYNIVSMNLSLGQGFDYHNTTCGGSSNPYAAAFANARAAGIIPVVAAGNDAYQGGAFHQGISAPACTPGALSVGAVYDSALPYASITWGKAPDTCTDNSFAADKITCFSQSGPLLTVLAPGALIKAAGIEEGGTSQATPHVAGAVAVLGAASSTATIDQLQAAIASTGPAITDTRSGAGNLVRHRLYLPDAIAALTSPFLSVAKAGTGTGTVTSSDGFINCGTTCSHAYTAGTSVTLTAVASDTDTTFDGWSGACTGTSTCVVTINALTSVTATFTSASAGGNLRPDALISLSANSGYHGENIYNPTGGTAQTLSRTVKRGKSGVFFLVVSNDGVDPDRVYVKGPGNAGKFSVRYVDLGSGQDITNLVRAGTVYYNLSTGQFGKIMVIVRVAPSALVGSSKAWKVVASSGGDPTLRDGVVAKVKAKA